jgi:peptide/nickel transport system permease protein
MLWFIARRLALLVLMLVGLAAITFTVSHIAPGDPAALAAGPDATKEMVEEIRRKYGLDRPLHEQFVIYIGGVLTGDFGESVRTSREVGEDLARYFPATFELVTFSMLIAVVLGVPLGMLSAVYRNGPFDHATRILSVSGMALPMFWLGLMLQLLLALHWGLLPLGGRLDLMTDPPPSITGMYLVDSLIAGQWGTFTDALSHIILPATALCFPALASILRVNRAEMLETLSQDYVTGARAAGISEWRIVTVLALKNAMIPTLAMIGLRYGWMLGGTVLVEAVFDWPGIGLYAVQSAVSADFQPIMGVTLLIGLNFMLANLLVDILYAWIDPRLREAR